jgi:hypothetical protein
MTADLSSITNYTDAIDNLPEEAFLGSLLWFSISQADVNLELARDELTRSGLDTRALRKILRPVDAFKKATREFAHKFKPVDGIRSEIMVRPVGEDGEQAHRHLILERAQVQAGKKRRVFYEKVGEIVFNRGSKKNGEYTGFSVESRRTTMNLGVPLTDDEDAWLTGHLADFEERFNHLLTHMDSHAVRSFVREYIDRLGGTCVKESGGLYFVAQEHVDEITALGRWVKLIGSEFHSLPLLNLSEQRDMILAAFEDETVAELERLSVEVGKILKEPGREIEEKTFDAYGEKAAYLARKIDEYGKMLGSRAERAATEQRIFAVQVMSLAPRIRQRKSHVAKVVAVTP